MITTPTKILFCAQPVNVASAPLDQAVWRPVGAWPAGLGILDWFGFVGICDQLTGLWTKGPISLANGVPNGVLGPENAVWCSGNNSDHDVAKLYAQPGWDFPNNKPVNDPTKAPGFLYVACGVGTP